MTGRIWRTILEQYGQQVTLCRDGEETAVKALVQPRREWDRAQQVPGPEGLRRQDRFLYLGPPGQPLDWDTRVKWQGLELRVLSAHQAGQGVCPYWRAVLTPGEGAAL